MCCCAWVTKTTYACSSRNEDNQAPGPGTPGTQAGRRTADPVHRILTVEAVYSPPSPGIRPDSFEVPPLYNAEFPTPFTFENETSGVFGLTNLGQDIVEEPPSYDDVIKADSRQSSRNTQSTQNSNNNRDDIHSNHENVNHDGGDDTQL